MPCERATPSKPRRAADDEQLGVARMYEFLQTFDWKKLYDTLQ